MSIVFYNRIKQVLLEKRSTNKALAEHLGYRNATVSNWARNATQPSIQDLYRTAEFLKVDIKDLLVSTTWSPGPSAADIAREKSVKARETAKKKVKRKPKK